MFFRSLQLLLLWLLWIFNFWLQLKTSIVEYGFSMSGRIPDAFLQENRMLLNCKEQQGPFLLIHINKIVNVTEYQYCPWKVEIQIINLLTFLITTLLLLLVMCGFKISKSFMTRVELLHLFFLLITALLMTNHLQIPHSLYSGATRMSEQKVSRDLYEYNYAFMILTGVIYISLRVSKFFSKHFIGAQEDEIEKTVNGKKVQILEVKQEIQDQTEEENQDELV